MATVARKTKEQSAQDNQLELIYREDRVNEYWDSTLFNRVYLTHDISDKIQKWNDDDYFAEFQDKIKNILHAYKGKERALESMSERNLQNSIVKDILCALNWANDSEGPIKPFIDDVSFTYKEKTYKPDIIVLEHPDDNEKVERAKAQERLTVARECAQMVVEVKYWNRIEKQFQKEKEDKSLVNKDRQDDLSGIVTPNDQTIRYMDLLKLNWGILTDGTKWRLFNKDLSTEGSDRYFEFNFYKLFKAYSTAETESEHKSVDQALRYFFHFFSRYSFFPEDGSEPLVDTVLKESKKYADKIEEDLKDRFLEAMNIACNAIYDSKAFDSIAQKEGLKGDESNTLIVNVSESILFNILFIKSLETRRVLPMISTDYKKLSLTSILWKIEQYKPENSELRNAKELERTFARGNGNSFQYTSGGFELHERMVRLVNAIHKGARKDTFGFEISGFKETIFSETELKVFSDCKIPNKDWVSILFMLGYTKSELKDSRKYQLIPYEFFTPRQLGSIYEYFLEFKLKKAEADLVFFKRKWQEGNLESEKVKAMEVPKVRKGQLYFSPNNEERKATGSYYTPDEVVQLIISETLGPLVKNKTSKEILKLKVADTAMGSGHFLSGALNYLAKKYLETLKKEILDDVKINITDAKQEVLHSCIYGADINARAVKLAKMSLWLESASTNRKLENLDDQVKCTNSLMDYELWKKEWKFLDNGVDAVIGNPPYLGEKGHKDIFQEIASGWLGKRFYQGKMDLFYFFFHLGLDILRPDGRLGFITTNYYTTALGARKLREDFFSRCNVDLLINLNELKVFGEAAGQHNMITLLTKSDIKSKTRVVNSNENGFCNRELLFNIYNGDNKKTSYSTVSFEDLYDGDEKYIRIGAQTSGTSARNSKDMDSILNRMKENSMPLSEHFVVSTGIMGGCDYINKTNIKYASNKIIEKNDIQLGDGVFVLDLENKRDHESLKKLSKNPFLKPFFKNSDIFKFGTNNKSQKKVIFSSKDNPATNNSETKSHLNRFKEILLKVREINKENENLWPVLRRGASNGEIFGSPKIVCPQRSKLNTFGYNEIDWYAASDVFFITQANKDSLSLKALLGLLNSKLVYFWLYFRGKRKGESLELTAKPLSEIPITKIEKSIELKIVKQVEILIHNHDEYAWDKLNDLIFNAYGISDDEIKAINLLYEEKSKSKENMSAEKEDSDAA